MSFFEDASLVLIPSAQKLSKIYSVKPTDGTGDLAFTRSNDTATRVASSGLIEKVRTNVVLQSNTFNTTWLTTDATITSGATDPNGGTTAWTLANTAASGIIQQAATLAGLRSVSIYAKQGTHRYLYMGAYVGSGTDSYQVFDLQNGVIPTGSKGRIESVGNGWYRCTSFGADGTTGGVQIFPSNNSLGAGTTNGNILIWRCQYESGDIATDYIATTTAAVSVGPVANVPRLDYLNSSCPRLLLEPQRINLVTFSEQINNADWFSNNLTITANQAISPDGYTNADLLDDGTAASTQHWFYQGTTLANSTTYTLSLYAKYVSRQNMSINIYNGASSQYVDYNIQNGTIVGSTGDVTASITSAGNGWYRLTYTRAMAASGGPNYRIALADDTGNETYTGSNKQTLIYGCQIEAGAYATSYIPTLGASVTRGADDSGKTGISSLIGQTEGVMFIDMEFKGYDNIAKWLAFLGTGNSYISFYTDTIARFIVEISNSGSVVFQNQTITFSVGQRYKLAVAYKANDFAFYINGTQIATDNSGTPPATSQFALQYNTNNDNLTARTYNQALLFKTRLTNAQLAELTTI